MNRSDIPFSGDDAHAFLPWVIGIMACMATLLLCLGVTVGSWMIDRGGSYTNSFTVNIPSDADNLADATAKIRDTLQKTPGITAVAQVSQATLRDMLKPWLGNSEAVDALPLPIVFDVTTQNAVKIDYKSLQAKLATLAPGTEIDAHELWVESFSHFSSALRALMTILATLIIGGLGLMIAFMSRASLKLHARTVSLLHSIGAEDKYIARQFQLEAFIVTLRGTLPGCLLAGLAYWFAGRYMASLQSSVIPPLSMSLSHIALLILMPLACGTVAWTAARVSVLKQLQRVL
jgi:cell division transport system permease protein